MRLKKVKNALERVKMSNYYVDEPQLNKDKWNMVFENNNPIHIEIGMGKGNFIIGMAKQNKDINYIGIEMYDSVMVKAVEKLKDEEPLNNLRLILLDAGKIDEVFENEISRIYLNFSDPWPKAKHAKRRLTSSVFLEKYEVIFLNHKNEIFQKTDNNDLFEFSMESLKNAGYELENVTRDLHSTNFEGNVMTEYEKKFSEMGIKINRLEAYKG